MAVLSKLIYRFIAILIKIPAGFFEEIANATLKFTGKFKKLKVAKTTLKNKLKEGGITPLNLRTYYKATVTKRVWYQHKNRHMDQWNRIESPKLNLHVYDFQQV